MTQSTFSLSWELHRNNICNGLSVFQQNGEFVDMTLAADGHHVKVHQMIMALASPYIKELISSATCPHPVIFLNKISYTTLRAILEYIYMGEVLVSAEHLSELVQAARELRIKGLQDMEFEESSSKQASNEGSLAGDACPTDINDDDICYFEVTDSKANTPNRKTNYTVLELDESIRNVTQALSVTTEENGEEMEADADEPESKKPRIVSCIQNLRVDPNTPAPIQYTVSNQGSLQMIVNRYVYYLKHCNRNNTRQWRCVDYLNTRKCPAIVFTTDDAVVQRISAHTHPFHDQRILKKVYAGAVFTALHEAEQQGKTIKKKSKEKTDE